jgi:hypothetical protein
MLACDYLVEDAKKLWKVAVQRWKFLPVAAIYDRRASKTANAVRRYSKARRAVSCPYPVTV